MNLDALRAWWQRPFNAEADATSWILFTGFVLIVIFLWTRVLHEAGHVIEKVA
jgi:hypothetical protein